MHVCTSDHARKRSVECYHHVLIFDLVDKIHPTDVDLWQSRTIIFTKDHVSNLGKAGIHWARDAKLHEETNQLEQLRRHVSVVCGIRIKKKALLSQTF